MNEPEVKKYLSSLSDSKFVELIYEALAKRNSGNSKLLIAESYYSLNGGAAHVALAALPPKDYPISSNDRTDLINNGVCNTCGVEIAAISKEAVCPVCQSNVGLT
jgi:predicted Zn-ribbon and HTH transcriptional regulator